MPLLLPLPPESNSAPPSALSPRQIDVLLLLASARGPCDRHAIAERCEVKSRQVCALMRPLVERGLVKQEWLSTDGARLKACSLTDYGREMADAIRRTREGMPGV